MIPIVDNLVFGVFVVNLAKDFNVEESVSQIYKVTGRVLDPRQFLNLISDKEKKVMRKGIFFEGLEEADFSRRVVFRSHPVRANGVVGVLALFGKFLEDSFPKLLVRNGIQTSSAYVQLTPSNWN